MHEVQIETVSADGFAAVLGELEHTLRQFQAVPYYYYREVSREALLAHFRETLLSSVVDSNQRAHLARRNGTACGLLLSSMRPWETEMFGLPAATLGPMIVAGEDEASREVRARLLAAARDELRQRSVRHTTIRVDPVDLATIHSAEAAGFIVTDVVFHQAVRLSDWNASSQLPAAEASDGVECRDAKLEDVPELREIAAGAYTKDRFHADPAIEDHRADAAYATWIENSCRGLADLVTVLVRDGRPRGFMTANLNRTAHKHLELLIGKIWLVGLAAEERGRGSGHALMRYTVNRLAELNADIVEVGTQVSNHAALRFYARAGFLPINSLFALRRLD